MKEIRKKRTALYCGSFIWQMFTEHLLRVMPCAGPWRFVGNEFMELTVKVWGQIFKTKHLK
jgi:hypothetical protein